MVVHWRTDGEPTAQHTDVMIDPLNVLNVVDYGDISPEPFNLERSIGHAIPFIREAAATGTALLICGGSHSVPYPAIRGIAEANGGEKGEIGVIHFDAHQDALPYGFGHPAHYGTFIRSIVEDGLVEGNHIIQVGMRGPSNSSWALGFQREMGITTYYMADIRNRGWDAVAEDILAQITKDFPDKIYISVDLDFFDASVAPGTTAPEHGGVMPVDFFPLLRALCITKQVVGVDLVEVSPMNDDRSGTTMLLGSRVFYEAITGMALKKQGITDPWYLHPDLIKKE